MQAPEPDDASSDLARGDRMVQSYNPDGVAFALAHGQRAEHGALGARHFLRGNGAVSSALEVPHCETFGETP